MDEYDLDLSMETDKILKHLENKLKDMKEIMLESKTDYKEKEALLEEQMKNQQGDEINVVKTWKKVVGDKFIIGLHIENSCPT